MATRRERLEARAERRRGWSGSAAARSQEAYEKEHAIGDRIPMGQPILVGHHSEGRARRDVARMQTLASRSIEEGRKSERHASAADSIEHQLETSIFDDDEDAVEQLRAKAARLEEERDQRKKANADYRIEHKAELKTMTPYERSQAVPYPTYSLTNLGSRIRDARQRADRLEREKAMVAAGNRGHGRQMESRYPGTCADCGESIERGDQILWFRLTREATHAECPAQDAA